MNDYYCKNCNNLVGQWNNKYIYYSVIYCNYIYSKNFNSIFFLDCKKCNKFIGILCEYVCENCFGKYSIIGEENLFNWFQKYKKIRNFDYYYCEKCGMDEFKSQYWFFEELTFYK